MDFSKTELENLVYEMVELGTEPLKDKLETVEKDLMKIESAVEFLQQNVAEIRHEVTELLELMRDFRSEFNELDRSMQSMESDIKTDLYDIAETSSRVSDIVEEAKSDLIDLALEEEAALAEAERRYKFKLI